MPDLVNHRGAPPTEGHTVDVAMDAHAVSADGSRLRTAGVADCLVMILHDTAHGPKGALAHISFPHSISQAQYGASHDLRILNHVARVRDAMINGMGSQPGDVDVMLWRGFGFGYSLPASRPDIQDNLKWGHFKRVIDFLGHFAPEENLRPSLPYEDSTSVIYDPGTGFAYFP